MFNKKDKNWNKSETEGWLWIGVYQKVSQHKLVSELFRHLQITCSQRFISITAHYCCFSILFFHTEDIPVIGFIACYQACCWIRWTRNTWNNKTVKNIIKNLPILMIYSSCKLTDISSSYKLVLITKSNILSKK